MGLLDLFGRPAVAEVPALDATRISNLVDVRIDGHRLEVLGVPWRPSSADHVFFRRQLGREITAGEQTAIEKRWAAQRHAGGVGGAHLVTTLDTEPSDDVLARFDRAPRRFR